MDEIMKKTATAIEAVQAMLDAMRETDSDQRSLAVAKTQFETAFLWISTSANGGGVLN